MSRYPTIAAVAACALLALLPLHPATAATGKSSTKKGTSSTKKKPSSTTTAKKTPSTPSPDAGTGTAKKGSGNSLDLPLPKKVGETEEGKPSESRSKAATTGTKGTASDRDGGSQTKKKSDGDEKSAEKTESEEKKPVEKSTDKTEDKSNGESAPKKEHAPSATVEPESISEFASQPPRIQQLIRDAVDLTRLNLSYTFGSAEPDRGGMDCSGTIYYLLKAHGFPDVPRDSSSQYLWARKTGAFYPVLSTSAESEEFKQLLPGDLMFWTGTYASGRDIPVSHVMIYLGKEKGSGKRIMFGSSDGRSYNGVQRWGVSVFDFKMPRTEAASPEKAKVDFVGYARIPGLRGAVPTIAEQVAAAGPAAEPSEVTPKKTLEPAKTPATEAKKKVTSTKRKSQSSRE